MHDDQTLDFYDREARAYADKASDIAEDDEWLRRFIARLPEGGRVLDLGCGSGWAAGAMAEAGYEVDALDACAGLAAEAWERHNVPVRVAGFDELDAAKHYDGVWASFSLLHEPRTAMPDRLLRVFRALKPSGHFYLSLKEGEGERRDGLGRFYSYYTAPEVAALLAAAGFEDIASETAQGPSFEGVVEPLLMTFARRPG